VLGQWSVAKLESRNFEIKQYICILSRQRLTQPYSGPRISPHPDQRRPAEQHPWHAGAAAAGPGRACRYRPEPQPHRLHRQRKMHGRRAGAGSRLAAHARESAQPHAAPAPRSSTVVRHSEKSYFLKDIGY
jgi:hypothetical protein